MLRSDRGSGGKRVVFITAGMAFGRELLFFGGGDLGSAFIDT
jgi:hypothetical protein